MIFSFGENEKDSLRDYIDDSYGKIITVKGGHRIKENFDPIITSILNELDIR